MANLLVATAGWLVKPTQARALKQAPPRSSSSNADANPGWLSRHSSLPSPGIEPPRTLRRSRSAGPDQAPLSKSDTPTRGRGTWKSLGPSTCPSSPKCLEGQILGSSLHAW